MLLTLAGIDWHRLIRQAGFFQEKRDFRRVRRRVKIKADHGLFPSGWTFRKSGAGGRKSGATAPTPTAASRAKLVRSFSILDSWRAARPAGALCRKPALKSASCWSSPMALYPSGCLTFRATRPGSLQLCSGVALWYVRSRITDAVGDGKMPMASEVDGRMARPREFDEEAVLDAAMQCFWAQGYESTSVKDLIERTGLTAASLYNAYGDKRAMFRTALDHYIESSIGARIRRSEALPPREALRSFFDDILRRSLGDREHKGCMIVNSALEMAPHDPEFRETIARHSHADRVILPGLRGEGPGRWDYHVFPAGGRPGTTSARRADGRARPGPCPPRTPSP